MPELKPSTVLLLLAVVAVVALYVLGAGLGATDRTAGRRGVSVSKEDRQAWRERFFKPRPVKVDELKLGSGCQRVEQELRVAVGQPCVLEVADSGPGVDPDAVPEMFRRGWTACPGAASTGAW